MRETVGKLRKESNALSHGYSRANYRSNESDSASDHGVGRSAIQWCCHQFSCVFCGTRCLLQCLLRGSHASLLMFVAVRWKKRTLSPSTQACSTRYMGEIQGPHRRLNRTIQRPGETLRMNPRTIEQMNPHRSRIQKLRRWRWSTQMAVRTKGNRFQMNPVAVDWRIIRRFWHVRLLRWSSLRGQRQE